MKKKTITRLMYLCTVGTFILLMVSACSEKKDETAEPLAGFVFVEGVQFEANGEIINIGDFEISDHPVTNREYKYFVDATAYPSPLHWKQGKIPPGREDYPVIFVNRQDADAYTRWLTEESGIVYRLPTSFEFELASRGGRMNETLYYWGNEETMLHTDNISFNHNRDRKYDQWETFLKPARWGHVNTLGLSQMAGNVWQLIGENQDPGISKYKFRIEQEHDMERLVMGGSWASTKEYLVCGSSEHFSPGLRLPDLGIRLVREPATSTWEKERRNIIAFPHSTGKISISWAYTAADNPEVSFNVYRLSGSYRNHRGLKLNEKPIRTTSYLDEAGIQEGKRYQYRVVALNASGGEENPSEWTSVTAGKEEYPIVVKFKPLMRQGRMLPVFGDLEGAEKLGCVIRMDNGNVEMARDPGFPVQLEAFAHTGKSLWRKDIANHSYIFGSANNCPFNVWDMDGDGRDEVITRYQEGEDMYVVILDGMSGKLLFKNTWDEMATDLSRSSTRIQMSIAYLDGKKPSVITMTGIYENEIISAYDHKLNRLWTYESFMETSGSGGHKIEVADVDGDGKQEIFYGTTCLNSDGSLRWSIYRQHPDIITIGDHIPEHPGLEVLYIVESSMHAGIYMVDASSGEIIWKNNREDDPLWSHGHVGWVSDIWDEHPGNESLTNRMGHADRNLILFTSDGERFEGFTRGFKPAEWDGDHTRELLSKNGAVIGEFNGKEIINIPGQVPNPVPNSSLIMIADLVGDFRSELVINTYDKDEEPAVMVLSAPDPIDKKFRSPQQDLEYKLWIARNLGGGYGSVHQYKLAE